MSKEHRQRKYNASVKGIARQFRSNHGYGYEESYFIARKCLNDFQRCEICGLPQWWNRMVLCQRGLFIRGDERVNRRLVPDHIIPGRDSSLKNTRILCHGCNDIRGAAILSDEEILEKVRWWFREHFPLRHLWWLNETPGKGGTLFRNKWMRNKAVKLLGDDGLKQLEYLQIPIDDSTFLSYPPVQKEGEDS